MPVVRRIIQKSGDAGISSTSGKFVCYRSRMRSTREISAAQYGPAEIVILEPMDRLSSRSFVAEQRGSVDDYRQEVR